MKLENFNLDNLYSIPRTRTHGNDDNMIYIKPNGFLLRACVADKLDLKNYKYIHFCADNQDVNRAKQIYFFPHNQEEHRDVSSNIKSTTINCMDIIKRFPKLYKLSNSKDKASRRLPLKYDQEVKGHYMSLPHILELETHDHRQLPDEKGIYALIDKLDEVVYFGQGDIKKRVNAHKIDKLNFNKIQYSFVDNQDDRDFWESSLIDNFRKERGRLPYYNKQNGNNYSKRLESKEKSENLNLVA